MATLEDSGCGIASKLPTLCQFECIPNFIGKRFTLVTQLHQT
jgi:hypothetical protein